MVATLLTNAVVDDTFPSITTLPEAVRDVPVLVNWTVLDVALPLFTTVSKSTFVSLEPSPMKKDACMFPSASNPFVTFVK